MRIKYILDHNKNINSLEIDKNSHFSFDVFPYDSQVCEWSTEIYDIDTRRQVPNCKIIEEGYFGNSALNDNPKRVILKHLKLLKERKVAKWEKYQFSGLTKSFCNMLNKEYGITLEELKSL